MKLHFEEDARLKLVSGIEKISKAVKSTLGPRGKTVIIESQSHTRGLVVTKDGVTVAKSILLDDPVENLAVRIMKEASENTATSAGDGTTTAIVLAESIAKGGLNIPSDVSVYRVISNIQRISEEVISNIKKKSKPATKSRLKQIATISANNDIEIGRLIADTYSQVGVNGVVLVERSMTEETYSEVIEGVRVDRGYPTKLFINNHETETFNADKCRVLITDVEIEAVHQIENILRPIVQNREPLLIVAPCSQQFIATMASNVIKNGLRFCIIEPPQFGYKQQELMSDLALVTGGRFFSQYSGDDLSLMSIEDLGLASKVKVERDFSVIIPSEQPGEGVNERIKELRAVKTKNKGEKDFINQRISYLSGGIGIIYVGGNSDVEQKERLDRVDDSVCAVRSAIEEGIVPGGGVALFSECKNLTYDASVKEECIAKDVMIEALRAPFRQLVQNAEIEVAEYKIGEDFGYDLKTGEIGSMFDRGIVDPFKVTKNALRNAVSVATTIMSTNVIITTR